MEHEITVTQWHIDHGVKGLCAYCPVALALHDAGLFGTVQDTWLTIGGKNYASPIEVESFVFDFDHSFPVEPFTFKLDLNAPQRFTTLSLI